MRWIYLVIGIFAVFMTFVVFFWEESAQRQRGLRICITAAVVNLGLFYAINWAKKQGEKKEQQLRRS